MDKQSKELKEIIEYINNRTNYINEEDIEEFKQWCIKK